MKKVIAFFAMLFVASSVLANVHIVLVTPRGETSMETIYKEEVRKQLPNKTIQFTLVVPDVNDEDEMRKLPETVLKLKPDLIYSWGTPTTSALAGTTAYPIIKDVPIVFTTVAYPVRQNIVRTLYASGRNVTGVSHLPSIKDQLLTIQSYKKFKTIGTVYNPTELNSRLMVEELKAEVEKFGGKLIAIPVDVHDNQPIAKTIPKKLEYLKKSGAEWLYIGPDTFIGYTNRRIVTFTAITLNLPQFTANESAIRTGHALYGMFSPIENLAKLTAQKTVEVLSGKKPISSIPVETLPKFVHVINLCTANTLKMYPPTILFRTGEIIVPKQNPEDATGCMTFD